MNEENIFDYVKKTLLSIKQERPETERKKATSAKDIYDMLKIMSEGNKDALTILCFTYIHKNGGLRALLTLENMNIRGNQVVYAFNYANQNLNTFVSEVKKKSPKMIIAVNIESAKAKEKEMAVLKNTGLVTFTPKLDDEATEFLSKQKSFKKDDQLMLRL